MKNKESLKLAIANHLAGQNDLKDYDFLLELINRNIYIVVLKVPVKMFFLGQTTMWKDRTEEEVFECLKEVVIEALENNGIEQTFVDEDWNNLTITKVKHERKAGWGMDAKEWYTTELNTTKDYVGEFFEFD